MDTLGCDLAKDVFRKVVSYLPLAHIAGMVYICSSYVITSKNQIKVLKYQCGQVLFHNRFPKLC